MVYRLSRVQEKARKRPFIDVENEKTRKFQARINIQMHNFFCLIFDRAKVGDQSIHIIKKENTILQTIRRADNLFGYLLLLYFSQIVSRFSFFSCLFSGFQLPVVFQLRRRWSPVIFL